MSSKELYFLPSIKEVRLANRSPIKDMVLTYKHKSIEDIIEKKEMQPFKNQKIQSILLSQKENKHPTNLYNKYEALPKIYLQRNRKQELRNDIETRPFLKKHLKSEDNEQTKIDDDGSYIRNKENSFNFNDGFYKEHFNKRLQEETDKMQFKLSYNYSQKQFMGEDVFRDDINLSERRTPGVKYTKIELTQEQMNAEMANLQKVPDFLMKILEPHKSTASI